MDKNILELEKLAENVLQLKQTAIPRRPIVIEFCGTPKSGKTSCISSLNIFLKRNGFRTKILTERAGICPINNKYDPSFNLWAVNSTIAQLTEFISNESKEIDVILLDRGIFDSLCWFDWHLQNNFLDENEYINITNYLTLKRWKACIDIIFVFQTTPDVSIEREYTNLLTNKTGTIMNKKVLTQCNNSIKRTIGKYKYYFRRIELINTSELRQNDVSYKITNATLNILKELITEQICFFKVEFLKEIKNKNIFSFNELPNLDFDFGRRDLIEKRFDVVQPVPIAVVTNKEHDKFLIVKKHKRSMSKHSKERNKLLAYIGGHIRKEDNIFEDNKQNTLLTLSKTTLAREIKEEIDISVNIKDNSPTCFWIKNGNSIKHMAICFIVEIDLTQTKIKLDSYEFVQKTGTSESGHIFPLKRVKDNIEKFEEWSKLIFNKLFNIEVSVDSDEQLLDFS